VTGAQADDGQKVTLQTLIVVSDPVLEAVAAQWPGGEDTNPPEAA
jgi:hypothetical protein